MNRIRSTGVRRRPVSRSETAARRPAARRQLVAILVGILAAFALSYAEYYAIDAMPAFAAADMIGLASDVRTAFDPRAGD